MRVYFCRTVLNAISQNILTSLASIQMLSYFLLIWEALIIGNKAGLLQMGTRY